jgi:hypothetical protein
MTFIPPPVAGDNPVGGATIPPLLNTADFADFTSLDPAWFLAAAGDTIRAYVRWHVAPSITETIYEDLTGDGTMLLPTQYLTGVTSITPPWPGAVALDPGSYIFDQRGWISLLPALTYGFAPNPSSANLRPIDTVRLFDAYRKQNHRMIVTFTHGYTNVPYDLAEVAYELVTRTMEKPAGVANEVQAGPYRYKFNEFGMVLSADQKNRLDRYKLAAVD